MENSQVGNKMLENGELIEDRTHNETQDKTKQLLPVKTDAIRERSFAFAVRIVKLCKFLEKNSDVSKSLIDQLVRAGTSVGVNLEEAFAGQSKADFIHKNSIALKESRESNFWLRLIIATSNFEENVKKGIVELEEDSLSISKIIGKIIITSKKYFFALPSYLSPFTFYL